MLVLILTNDFEFSAELASGLENGGHQVEVEHRPDLALARLAEVDGVLLDLHLSGADGFEVCRAIRSASPVPLIVADAHDDVFDRVLSFKLGADDHVHRSCSVRELTARLEAVVRRVDTSWQPWKQAGAQPDQVHDLGEVQIAPRNRRVTVHGEEVALTRKEFDILALLASDAGRVFDREDIMREVWGHDGAGDTRTLGVHMVGLRRKLGTPALIETVRGIGFRLNVARRPERLSEREAAGAARRAG
ncbi:response regulator transcription factor [Streptomyces sp. Ru72]|uniref:response regulator transcription factor n=1 Tax=Streptomyces sp. Ru72 TaxID=2080747 RepID=UPI000CDE25B2|nr:response regulator transcription factor [Streptomyces sp. Ru72]POX46508.1 DNA-binding response regulator [Streptomyces sp. Ru72]